MINKKIIIISLLFVILMSVQCVSAIDDADINIMGDNEDNGVLQAPSETQTYTDLKTVIDNAGDEITLDYNYQFNNAYGSTDPRTGINITKDLVINGNGATITGGGAQNPCALFNISSGVTVTLKNLTIINNGGIYHDWQAGGTITAFRVIYSEGTLNIENCTVRDCTVDDWTHPEVNGTIYSTGGINVQNSKFISNTIANCGVIYTTARLTVNSSYFEGNNAGSKGGAIYAGSISLIENSTFTNNNGNYGGAIYTGSIDIIENSTFTNNKGIYGGAICISNRDSVTSIKNSTFEGNGGIYREPGSSEIIGAFGGAIYTLGSINLIEDSTFKMNIASAGGAIFILGGDYATSIKNSTFDGQAFNDLGNGGAIFTFGAIDLIENSTFKNMSSSGDGGAIYIDNEYSNTKIINSTFDSLKSYAKGGAIYTTGMVDIIENSTFKSNMGKLGTIFTRRVKEIANSNFTDNAYLGVGSKGGAIYIDGNYNLLINNSTFNGNMADEGGAIYTYGTLTIYDSYFDKNGLKTNNPALNGGALYTWGKVNIENSTFGINYAENGGAIYSRKGVDFFNSYANGSGMNRMNLNGSLIYAKGNVNVVNSTIDAFCLKNILTHGVVYAESNVLVNNSTFSNTDMGNGGPYSDAGSVGGAIYALGNGKIYNSNFTNNTAKQYSSVYVGGTLEINNLYFFNNTHGCVFAEGSTVADNITFLNNAGGTTLNGRVIGSNSTLNITNSYVVGTHGQSGTFNGTIFAKGNLHVENCTIDDNHALGASARGLALCTNSNITILNSNLDNNSFSGQDCYGCNIYAKNAYVENCTFFNSTVLQGQGKTHGVAIYVEENMFVSNSSFRDLYSMNSQQGALSGVYVEVENCTFYNITGFGARGAAIHADVANVSSSSFYLINSTINSDWGGAIYANNTYVYYNNFTNCSAGGGGAIYTENYTVAYENIFIDNQVNWAGGAIFTKNGNMTYNVFLRNGIFNSWGSDLCDIAIEDDAVDSLELNWWGENMPFIKHGVNRTKVHCPQTGTGGIPYLPDTWVIMDFYITDPMGPIIGQGVNLTSALERYYDNTTGDYGKLDHNVAKRTVLYNATNNVTGVVEGKFDHDIAPIISKDYVMYSNNNFENHSVSATIDYQTLYISVRSYEINVTKTVTNETPKVGDIINYTIIVNNIDTTDYSDPSSAYTEPPIMNITISDVLDDRLELLAVNGTPCSNKTVTWDIKNMEVNTTHTLILTVRVRGFGNITNVASITKVNGTELKNPYNGTNVTIYVNETTFVKLNVTKTANASNIYLGDKVEFTITVNNTGTSNATNVRVWDILPAGFEWESGGSYDTSTRNVTWNAVDIEAEKSASFVVVVRAVGEGNISNIAYAHADENETIFNGTSDNVTVNPFVNLTVSKSVNVTAADVVFVGDKLRYTITVKNNGLSTATGVNVTDVVDSSLVVVVVGDCCGCCW